VTPILTFTANLVAETTYYTDRWEIGGTSRADKERFQVGGKGINVCKMLRRLGAESSALCFPGGAFGALCEQWLRERDIPYQAFKDECVTRSGSVIRAAGQEESTILGLDSHVSGKAVTKAVTYLESVARPYHLALCGVFQDWQNPNWNPLREWIEKRPSDVQLAVDTYGPSLPWFAKVSRPNLIKINRQELETLFDEDERNLSTESLLERASDLSECPLWIVTDGKDSIRFKEQGEATQSIQPREVESVSPTGCGDVFFATLLNARVYRPELELREAVELAAEYATRNAASPEIAEFSLD
jgi:1-phosphofructokinase